MIDPAFILKRRWLTPQTTIGELLIRGSFQCFILEDFYRGTAPKVPKLTAIPCGTYEIIVDKSPRFSKLAGHDVFLPRLLGVPNFEGILIHPGNDQFDTDGCLLPGRTRATDRVGESVLAFNALFPKIIAEPKPLFIRIEIA